MPEFIDVAPVMEIAEGHLKRAMANNREILLAKVHGQLYATDLYCPHLQGDLSKGTLNGTILTCPIHKSQFDIRDGHVIRWTSLKGIVLTLATTARPPRPLRLYPVRINKDRILVSVT
jgi:nitrite reductase/ring-hydroxylating ferredoxin subunit